MEFQIIDILFMGFITLVVVGGIFCLLIFLPKEHDFDEAKKDCYRIEYRDGVYSVSRRKATYGENIWSIRSKFFYIKKVPFQVEAFCDDAQGKDKKHYRAAALVTVYFPENLLNTFAENFHNVPHEAVEETISETLSAALEGSVSEYEGDRPYEDFFKDKAGEKLKLFGAIVMSVNDLKVTTTSQPQE